MSNCVDFYTLRKVYFAKFQSILTYGLTIWGGTSVENFNRLFIIQKRAIRIIHGAPPDEHCQQLFKTFRVMTLACLYIFELAKYFVKTTVYLLVEILYTTLDIVL